MLTPPGLKVFFLLWHKNCMMKFEYSEPNVILWMLLRKGIHSKKIGMFLFTQGENDKMDAM
jgi:hypothetical protein